MDTKTVPADRNARDRLANSLQLMVDEADHLLQSAQRTGTDQFNAARDKFESRLRLARAELAELQDSAGYKMKRAARSTDLAAHEHPYAAMGVGAGIGLLLGMLIASR